MKQTLDIDDTLDVFAVHGVGGIFGTIMIAVFGYGSFVGQGVALLAVGVFTIVLTFVIAKAVGAVFPLRVSQEDEVEGLDYAPTASAPTNSVPESAGACPGPRIWANRTLRSRLAIRLADPAR